MIFQIQTWVAQIRPWIRPATKSDIQILRKCFHIGFIASIALLYEYVFTTPIQAFLILMAIGGSFMILDLSRLWIKPLNRFIITLFSPVMRKRELNTVSATTPFLLALGMLLIVFPKPLVMIAILSLAFGDAMANFIGLKFGKDKIYKNKS
ncbi:MAG: hypothetical protein HY390_06010, partial [Deltaproteobacteria bacterium]|nr:hypothetical protein [Deltaproteobacteria bacterium]